MISAGGVRIKLGLQGLALFSSAVVPQKRFCLCQAEHGPCCSSPVPLPMLTRMCVTGIRERPFLCSHPWLGRSLPVLAACSVLQLILPVKAQMH